MTWQLLDWMKLHKDGIGFHHNRANHTKSVEELCEVSLEPAKCCCWQQPGSWMHISDLLLESSHNQLCNEPS